MCVCVFRPRGPSTGEARLVDQVCACACVRVCVVRSSTLATALIHTGVVRQLPDLATLGRTTFMQELAQGSIGFQVIKPPGLNARMPPGAAEEAAYCVWMDHVWDHGVTS